MIIFAFQNLPDANDLSKLEAGSFALLSSGYNKNDVESNQINSIFDVWPHTKSFGRYNT
jgi:hypothetical protein